MLNYREKEEEEEGQVEEHKIETLGSLENSAGQLRGIARSAGKLAGSAREGNPEVQKARQLSGSAKL